MNQKRFTQNNNFSLFYIMQTSKAKKNNAYECSSNVTNHPSIKHTLLKISGHKRPRSPPRYKLDANLYRELLRNHPDQAFVDSVCKEIKEGVKLTENKSIECCSYDENYKLSIIEIEAIINSCWKGISGQHIWGPFYENEELPDQLKGGRISPLFTKDESTATRHKIREIVDLSANYKGMMQSLNDCIDPTEKEVKYITLKEIIRFIVDNNLIY